jgi:hypothetical protein
MLEEINKRLIKIFWILALIDIAILLSAVAGFVYFDRLQSNMLASDYYELRDVLFDNSKVKTQLLGSYYNNAYYCVWTKGRTDLDIENTEKHEYCHYLIAQTNSTHFCDLGVE